MLLLTNNVGGNIIKKEELGIKWAKLRQHCVRYTEKNNFIQNI